MTWVRDLAEVVKDLEFGQWAGITNFVGWIILVRRTGTTVTERVMHGLLFAWERWLACRAAKRSVTYKPTVRTPQPKPSKTNSSKDNLALGAIMIACVVTLGLIAHYAPPLSA